MRGAFPVSPLLPLPLLLLLALPLALTVVAVAIAGQQQQTSFLHELGALVVARRASVTLRAAEGSTVGMALGSVEGVTLHAVGDCQSIFLLV